MSDSGLDFIEADFGEQNAAGGAYHLNKPPEYWDKWILKNVRSPIWPFFFLILLSLGLAGLPMVLEWVMASTNQSQQTVSADAPPAQTAVENAPQVEQVSQSYQGENYERTPGYDVRFGHPAR